MTSVKSEQASFNMLTSLKYKFVLHLLKGDRHNQSVPVYRFLMFKPLSYYFKETIGFDVKASLTKGPLSGLIKPGDIIKSYSVPWDFSWTENYKLM